MPKQELVACFKNINRPAGRKREKPASRRPPRRKGSPLAAAKKDRRKKRQTGWIEPKFGSFMRQESQIKERRGGRLKKEKGGETGGASQGMEKQWGEAPGIQGSQSSVIKIRKQGSRIRDKIG